MPRRSVSQRQGEILVDFVETHRDLVMGRMAGPMGSQATRQAWQNLALKLNSLGCGVQRTGPQWRRYWVEWKARTRVKAADSRRMMRGTGGGPNRLEPLSSLEERILALIGNVAVDGLPDVRVPLEGSSNTHDSPSILAGVQVLGGTPITAIDVPTQIQPNIDELIVEHVPVQREEIVELQTPLSPVFVLDNQAVLEDHVLSTPSTATAAVVETPTQAQDIPTATNRRTQPRRRRLQNRLSQNRQIFQDLNAPHWAYEMEQRRLANEERTTAALENLTVQLTEVVRSLNKIVAAIENK